MTRARDRLIGKSNYGSGFVLCLIKFAEHAERFDGIPDPKIKQTEIKRWFYEASDHLSGLRMPEIFKGTKIEEIVRQLENLSWGLRLSDATLKNIDDAIHLVRLIAMEVDKYLGLEPDIGRN
jgi:hypothetical protein